MYDLHCLFLCSGSLMSGQLFRVLYRLPRRKNSRFFFAPFCHFLLGVSVGVFYAVPTARVIFTGKTSLDVFSLSREQVWTFSVLGDGIYEIRCLFVAVGLNAHFIVLPH